MIKNGKFYLSPPRDGRDLKDLFRYITVAGIGRPVDGNGIPEGPWTPDLLADAISQVERNGDGIDSRTVQLWFQDNKNGISTSNLRWLAHILGCGDPEAIRLWQTELAAARIKLAAKRSEERRHAREQPKVSEGSNRKVIDDLGASDACLGTSRLPENWSGLGSRTAALFGQGSYLNIPVLIFSGAVLLGLLAYAFRIHSATYPLADGRHIQVGFLWAPNWSLTFIAVLPLYMYFFNEVLCLWKHTYRPRLISHLPDQRTQGSWESKVASVTSSFWANFVVCVLGLGGFQWTTTRLLPLIDGNSRGLPIDWSRLTLVQPDTVSLAETILFTAIAWGYMAICTYLFFSCLILLYILASDYCEVSDSVVKRRAIINVQEQQEICVRLMSGTFRCAVLGMTISVLMKLQTMFLLSGHENIVDWLAFDLRTVFGVEEPQQFEAGYREPVLFTSFLLGLVTCAIFFSCLSKGHTALQHFKKLDPDLDKNVTKYPAHAPWIAWIGVIVILAFAHLLVGAFYGFSVILIVAAVTAVYSLFCPSLGYRSIQDWRNRRVF